MEQWGQATIQKPEHKIAEMEWWKRPEFRSQRSEVGRQGDKRQNAISHRVTEHAEKARAGNKSSWRTLFVRSWVARDLRLISEAKS